MDDLAFGRLVKLARMRRRMRQQEVATAAGVSRPVVSRLERGHLGELRLSDARAIAAVVDIRIEVQPRSRAVDLDRISNGRHAALADYLVRWIGQLSQWAIKAEVSYSEYGERGVIDLVCWHAATRSLLIVEIKTELMDFGELLAKLDAKERLAPRVAERFGWRPLTVSTCLLVADSSTNRRRATAHAALIGAALPSDGVTLTRWLKSPVGVVHAIRFVADVRPGNVRSGFAGPSRVRVRGGGRVGT